MMYCIYLRKSRRDIEDEQRGEGETLARHRAMLTELAARRGLPIGHIYHEIVSGDTISDRPVMQELLRDVLQAYDVAPSNEAKKRPAAGCFVQDHLPQNICMQARRKSL